MDREKPDFPDIPLNVDTPPQGKDNIEIVPVLLPLPTCICNTNKFTVIRCICNLGIFRAEEFTAKNLSKPIQTFDPKITLEVFYTEADLAQLEEGTDKLKLAYWNMQKWVIIEEWERDVLLKKTVLSVTVNIDSFLGDPTLGWGR